MTIGKKNGIGVGVAPAILVAVGLLASWSTYLLTDANHWVTHTQDVLVNLETLLSLMKDAETGQRGYIITGEEPYLDPYTNAVENIEPMVKSLRSLTADNLEQQRR